MNSQDFRTMIQSIFFNQSESRFNSDEEKVLLELFK
jgi:hypothetical protein